MPKFGRCQSVAEECKGARIRWERSEAPNPHYLPGLANGLQMLRPIPSIGSGSPGASEWRGAGR
jgi:hypothetical protein